MSSLFCDVEARTGRAFRSPPRAFDVVYPCVRFRFVVSTMMRSSTFKNECIYGTRARFW